MAGFDYVGSGAPTFGGPAAAPAQYFDKQNRVTWMWDGVTGIWIPSPGTNVPQDNVTAAGNNQATATVLPVATAYNLTTVPASSGVLLPPSWSGAEIAVNNSTATATALIYPNGTETINALSAGAGLVMAANTIVILYCFTKGKWFTK